MSEPRFGQPLDEQAAEWREKLLRTVEPIADLPILLSGGTDSATLLAAAVDLGARPHCYLYSLTEPVSDDFRIGRRMAEAMRCGYTAVWISRTRRQLEEDVRRLVSTLRTARKTSIQCAQPLMHLARRIRDDGFDRAVVGTGAVVLDDRRVMEIRANEGEEAARAYREEKLEDRHLDCGTGRMHEIARRVGVTLEEPYSDEPVRSHALALDVTDLNRGPRGFGQKGIAVRAFPGFWMREPRWYRRNSPLQVNSGLREWHDDLLALSDWNPMGAKRVGAVYNRLLRSLDEPNLLDSTNA